MTSLDQWRPEPDETCSGCHRGIWHKNGSTLTGGLCWLCNAIRALVQWKCESGRPAMGDAR